jgi:hypothetical protein
MDDFIEAVIDGIWEPMVDFLNSRKHPWLWIITILLTSVGLFVLAVTNSQ